MLIKTTTHVMTKHWPLNKDANAKTSIITEQYNPWDKSTINHKLLKTNVLAFETCWAANSEIIKQVTSSWSIFIQLWMVQLNVTVPKVVAMKISRYLTVPDTVYNICSFILFVPTSFIYTSQWRQFCEIMPLKKIVILEQKVTGGNL